MSKFVKFTDDQNKDFHVRPECISAVLAYEKRFTIIYFQNTSKVVIGDSEEIVQMLSGFSAENSCQSCGTPSPKDHNGNYVCEKCHHEAVWG